MRPNQEVPIRIQAIDSHTAGEPTRVVVSGGPDLGSGSVSEKLLVFREKFDWFRSTVVNEPRGSDVLVGALLLPPTHPDCSAGVIFFNNVGFLGMCGHGLIGLMVTLDFLGRLKPGRHLIETPVGIVQAQLNSDGRVSIRNVPAFRKAKDVCIALPNHGHIRGDIAWGGNWFFLTENPGPDLNLSNIEALTDLAWQIRQAVNAQGFPEVDHIEFFGSPQNPLNQSRNFVLCPGRAYDRSPCGTGTSAKVACLMADGILKPGQIWKQEGILGTVFEAEAEIEKEEIIPVLIGQAWITSKLELFLDPSDPFRFGIK